MDGSRDGAWRFERRAARAAALVAALGGVATAACEWPDATDRAERLYAVVLPLGYAHILGASIFDARRHGWPGSLSIWIATPLVGVAAVSLLAVYAAAIDALGAALLIPLVGISTWHTFENDLALAGQRSRRLALPPLSPTDDHQLPALALTSLFVWACASSEEGRATADLWIPAGAPVAIEATRFACVAALIVTAVHRDRWRCQAAALAITCAGLDNRWLGLSDLIAAATLYHALSWALVALFQLRSLARDRPEEARRRRRTLALVHTLPLLAFAAVWLAGPALETARQTLTSPGLYLFWSVLHVLQTSLARSRRRA